MTRFRRLTPKRGDDLAAAMTSVVVGAGAALVTYYLTRLYLTRDELPQRTLAPSDAVALPPADGASPDQG